MRILITSERVSPARGGLSSILDRLGKGLFEAGQSLMVLMSKAPAEVSFPFGEVVSLADEPMKSLRALRGADVVIQNNVALKTLLPALALGKKVIVVLHIWVQGSNGTVRPQDRLKRALLRRCLVGAPNPALYERLGIPGHFIPNAYDSSTFGPRPSSDRAPRRGAVFVGRLIPEKGIEELVRAHAAMTPEEQERLPLTIVGGALDEEFAVRLREAADEHTAFLGALAPEEIAAVLQRSTLLVAPSTGEEIFGLVILEALACGVRPVITDIEGMVQAAGGFGQIVRRDDDLTEQLTQSMRDHMAAGAHPLDSDDPDLQKHLLRYQTDSMIAGYATLIEEATGRSLTVTHS